MTPYFLKMEQVLSLHAELIDKYGGTQGVRDTGLLESALATPQAGFGGEFLHGTIYEMAAAYLFHLVQNHPFLDGNKRIGAATAIVFLAMNNLQLEATEESLVELTLSVACGQADKGVIAGYFEKYCVKTVGE